MSNDTNRSMDIDRQCNKNKKQNSNDDKRLKANSQDAYNRSTVLNDDKIKFNDYQPTGNVKQASESGLDKIFSDTSVFKTYGIGNKLNIEYLPHTSVIKSTVEANSQLSQAQNLKINNSTNNSAFDSNGRTKYNPSETSLEKFKESKEFTYYKTVPVHTDSKNTVRYGGFEDHSTRYLNMFVAAIERLQSLDKKDTNTASSSSAVAPNSIKIEAITPKEANVFERGHSLASPTAEIQNSKITPRAIKKAWLYRHTGEDELENAKFDQNGYNNKRFADSIYYSPNLEKQKPSYNTNGGVKNDERTYARKLFEDKVAKQGIKRNLVTLDDASTDLLNKAKNIVINHSHIYGNGISCPKKEKKDVDDMEYTQLSNYFKNNNKREYKKYEFTFLQDGPCSQAAPKLAKCRECRWSQNQDSENVNNIFCRFNSFRKLRYTKNLTLATSGFSNPFEDPTEEDKSLWLPKHGMTLDLDTSTCRFILSHVGDQFCDLVEQEKQAAYLNRSDVADIAWKKLVKGVREMCDVCETTLFNYHWTCGKCGFIVCLDCYRHRIYDTGRLSADPDRDYDEFNWLLCTNRTSHELQKLMLTQIIPGDCLLLLSQSMHKIRSLLNINQYCTCRNESKPDVKDFIMDEDSLDVEVEEKFEVDTLNIEEDADSQHSNASNNIDNIVYLDLDYFKYQKPTVLDRVDNLEVDTDTCIKFRDMIMGTDVTPLEIPSSKSSCADTVDVVASKIVASTPNISNKADYFEALRVEDKLKKSRNIPVRTMTNAVSSVLYPGTPHTWLCDGKLLRLLEANHSGNYEIFQEQWIRGQPVIVSNVSNLLDMKLWHPSTFAQDFGSEKNDLVNCMTGRIVPNQPMEKFWEGFENLSKRLQDEDGNPMLLKLKDWPPGEDFAELLPTRFQDLMKALPLGEYTKRNGKLNLAGCLPDCFVRPDLGPKMYNAYGSALYQSKGTTNLHLDISDAVNVMVYVGIPKDGNYEEHIEQAFAAIDEAGCDILTRRRVRESTELPGALWHIYAASDADKIRDLLNKVSVESGNRLEPRHDPIHDQNCYLDRHLRGRLYKEYGVEGYPIVQCWGDAVFIPAGAPHQVRNLHNCIKVAEDFVSPENISMCFRLTQEFRELSDTHSNHEDKLQIKNIIYHAVKDALTCLSGSVKQEKY